MLCGSPGAYIQDFSATWQPTLLLQCSSQPGTIRIWRGAIGQGRSCDYWALPHLSTCRSRCVSAGQALRQALLLPSNLQGKKTKPLKILVTPQFWKRSAVCAPGSSQQRCPCTLATTLKVQWPADLCPWSAALVLMTACTLVYSNHKGMHVTTT